MKSIFDSSTTEALVQRISNLRADANRAWGKMTPYQMVKHCILSEEMYLGMTKYKRLFIGRLFGKMALNAMLKDATPIKKNEPTHPSFKITGDGNFEQERAKWVELIKKYQAAGEATFNDFIHPFFGKMDKQQVGVAVYKHVDHHLRQFGV